MVRTGPRNTVEFSSLLMSFLPGTGRNEAILIVGVIGLNICLGFFSTHSIWVKKERGVLSFRFLVLNEGFP